jgi:uncharacterized protein (DUF433 family)
MATTAPFDLGTLVTCTPGVYGGRPCLAGTRYPVLEIAVHYTAGMSADEIADEYGLALAHVHAGIAYYLANEAAIDSELEEERREYDAGLAEHIAKQARASA